MVPVSCDLPVIYHIMFDSHVIFLHSIITEWLYKQPMVPKEMVSELSRKAEAKSRILSPKIVSKL